MQTFKSRIYQINVKPKKSSLVFGNRPDEKIFYHWNAHIVEWVSKQKILISKNKQSSKKNKNTKKAKEIKEEKRICPENR